MKKSLFNHKKKKAPKLNITSLMDALTIILIFLLVNYSDNPEERDLPKFISLPQINGAPDISKTAPLLVVIGKNQLSLGKELNIDYKDFDSSYSNIEEQLVAKIEKIKNEKATEKRIPATEGTVDPTKEEILKVALQADKEITYEQISKVIKIFSSHGYNDFDFMALKTDK